MKRTSKWMGAISAGVVMGSLVIGVGNAGASPYAPPAPAAPVVSAPITEGLAGPLQFEVSDSGRVLVAQSFSGTVSVVGRDGTVSDLFNDPGVDGVAAGPFGSTWYTHTDDGVAELRLRFFGQSRTVADLHAYEVSRNPDQGSTYGLQGLSAECAALLPPDQGILPYTGGIDSHPYALTPVFGGVLVADAAANAILFVNYFGKVSTVAVLPAQAPVTISAEAAAANELPECTAGASFIAEPVPTDVELGPDGQLYVSTLPGGPEDPSLGARGSVYRVNPWTGKSKQIATGFAGATNLAISPKGTIYVSELFADQVSKVVGNHGVPVASVPSPSGLEWSRGRLYVGADTFGSGQLVTISNP